MFEIRKYYPGAEHRGEPADPEGGVLISSHDDEQDLMSELLEMIAKHKSGYYRVMKDGSVYSE